MRRTLTSAAFLLLILAVPVYAQHGGHGGGGGGHAGSSGGHAGGFSGGHGFGGGFAHSGLSSRAAPGGGMRLAPSSAPHSFSRYGPSPVSHSSSRPASQWTYFGGHRSVRGNRGRPDHHSLGTRWSFRTVCPGCWGYGYPYYGYDPFLDSWWWDSGSYPNEEQVSSPTVAEESENPDEQPSQDQDAYAGPPSDPPAPQDPATVLVFRDGHHQEIQNYAIVGPLLWNFTGSRTEKIPLTSLDIAATEKANDDRGVDFHLPTAPAEGQ